MSVSLCMCVYVLDIDINVDAGLSGWVVDVGEDMVRYGYEYGSWTWI